MAQSKLVIEPWKLVIRSNAPFVPLVNFEGINHTTDSSGQILIEVNSTGIYSIRVNSPLQTSVEGARFVFVDWGDGLTSAARSVDMTSDTILSITLEQQYYLIVDSTHGQPSGQGWYDAGSTASYGVPGIVSGSPGTRYVFTGWQGSGVGSYTGLDDQGSMTVSGPVLETAEWTTQYLVTYHAEGCVLSMPVPANDWVEVGSRVNGAFVSNLKSSDGLTQCNYLSDNRTSSVTGPINVEGTYQTQYYLTVSSSYGTPTGQGWCNAGSSASFGIETSTVSGGTGVRFVFSGWNSTDSGGYEGSNSSDAIKMSNPIADTAKWTTQYYLGVTSEFSEVEGAGWYDSGTYASISVKSTLVPQTLLVSKAFDGWGGNVSGSSSSLRVLVGNPENIVAKWTDDYIQLYLVMGLVAAVAAVAGFAIVKMRTNRLT
jgi:hypothetical protein